MTSISRDLNDVSFPLRFTSRRHADQSRKWRMSLTKLKTAGFPMQITVSGLIKIIVEAGIYLSLLKIHFYAKNSLDSELNTHSLCKKFGAKHKTDNGIYCQAFKDKVSVNSYTRSHVEMLPPFHGTTRWFRAHRLEDVLQYLFK